MKACFPDIYDMEQKHGSLAKGMFKARGMYFSYHIFFFVIWFHFKVSTWFDHGGFLWKVNPLTSGTFSFAKMQATLLEIPK